MRRKHLVLLGMMSKMPVAGVVWQTVHYLVGLERLGFDVYYVEAHARTPSMFLEHPDEDGSAKAAAFIDGVCRRFGFEGCWAYHALHDDGRVYGMSEQRLRDVYADAELLINLHGGTEPRPEHAATGRLVLLETDPVELQVQLHEGRPDVIDFLEPHVALFSYGENFGRRDCGLPPWEGYRFRPTRQPVVLDFWAGRRPQRGESFTTIGNWRQQWRDLQIDGESYTWSKHHEFLKFIELPSRTQARFELALGSLDEDDRRLLERYGWLVRDPAPLSADLDAYREFVATSRGEFTVAKDQNVRLRTGWFSDRSATYLAAGRPVVTQDTGFGSVLPTGAGLFAFSTLDEAVAAVEEVERDGARHAAAAAEIAREHFDAAKVLRRLLDEVDVRSFPPSLVLMPVSRRPTTVEPETAREVLRGPLPTPRPSEDRPEVSVVVVTADGLVFTRLCLESVLGQRGSGALEVVVVDNCSADGTRRYLARLAEVDARVRVVLNTANAGFAAAVNQGLAAARGRWLVVLNNDVVLPPAALSRLVAHLADGEVGLVGPLSNEAATEAEVDARYRTYGQLVLAADECARRHAGKLVDVEMLTMFCVATSRAVLERVGPLDERFEVGLFEDDDYSLRVRRAGLRVACAEDVLVHHFGEAAFGKLVPTGEYGALFEANRRRFEQKWGVRWSPHRRRANPEYDELVRRVRRVVCATVPDGALVLVVSKGDDELLRLNGLRAAHFPRNGDGVYAGHHPGDDGEAIRLLEAERRGGAEFLVVPQTAAWWLEHYRGLRSRLDDLGGLFAADESCSIFRLAGSSR